MTCVATSLIIILDAAFEGEEEGRERGKKGGREGRREKEGGRDCNHGRIREVALYTIYTHLRDCHPE